MYSLTQLGLQGLIWILALGIDDAFWILIGGGSNSKYVIVMCLGKHLLFESWLAEVQIQKRHSHVLGETRCLICDWSRDTQRKPTHPTPYPGTLRLNPSIRIISDSVQSEVPLLIYSRKKQWVRLRTLVGWYGPRCIHRSEVAWSHVLHMQWNNMYKNLEHKHQLPTHCASYRVQI